MGLIMGLSVGLGSKFASDAGATVLFDADFTTPSTSWSAGRTGFSSAYADTEWQFQTYSSGYAADTGSGTLTNTGGLTGQTAVGIWDGSSYTGRNAWEVQSINDYLQCSNTTACDSNNEDFCFRLVFRAYEDWTNGRYLLSKRLTNGWLLYQQSNTLRLFISDGTNAISLFAPASITEGDGALHYVTGWYDYSADMLYMKSDLFSEVSTSTATMTGSISNSEAFIVGNRHGTQNVGMIGTQFCYVGHCAGANAQAMYDEEFWNHATDPTGLLTTATRASAISAEVAAGYVAHFSDNQLPIGYHSAFSHTSKLGLYCNSATTNLLTYSEALSNWTQSGTSTTTDNSTDSPDGFRSASLITAGAVNDFIKLNFTTVAATEYTISVHVLESTVGCTGRLIFYDETGAAELASQTFTCTSSWDNVVSVTATTNGGQVSSSIRIEIDNNTESLYAWGAQAELGDGRTAYIRTNGASASLAACDYRGGSNMKSLAGEVASTFVLAQTDDAYIWQSRVGVSINNLPNHYVTIGLLSRMYWANNAGGAEANHTAAVAHTAGVESTTRHLWDTNGIDSATYETILYADGARNNGSAMPLESTIDDVTADVLYIGNGAGTFHLDGVISRIQIYDAPGALT